MLASRCQNERLECRWCVFFESYEALLTLSQGRDDFFCLTYPDGALVAWQNTPGSDVRSPNWVSLGVIFNAVAGCQQYQIRLGDIE
jgi:hypothetical protein